MDDARMIAIDSNFRALMPPLSDEQRIALESSIVADGCLDPLIVWLEEDILLDGHNRYEICARLGVEYQIAHVSLRNREEAADWIDAHQLGRRNLTPDQAALIRGRRYNRLKDQGKRTDLTSDQNEQKSGTAERLASEHGVSESTIKRDAAFARDVEALKEVEPDIEQRVVAGKGPTRKAIREAVLLAKTDKEAARQILSPSNGHKPRERRLGGAPAEKTAIQELDEMIVDEMFKTIMRHFRDIKSTKKLKSAIDALTKKLSVWSGQL